MRDETVARNYAETLFELARRNDAVEGYGEAIETVARLLDENPRFREFVETPRIAASDKKRVVKLAFEGPLPKPVVTFLLVTIDKRRQRLLRSIAREYHALVDEHLGRVHVEVTLARELDEDAMRRVAERLSGLLGRTAIPHVRVKPEILGGLMVRAGDTIYDGSVRRRLETMRRRLLAAHLPESAAPGPETTLAGADGYNEE
ncbi:MAG: ATP synthase F1 subunit delta [Gemmatimonadetes bacterium]|nr:ATP synthase F1 subunit delta [Gemmatimonadota bacterium]